MEIKILDSTLRDGAQGEGISFSIADKLKIVKTLDDLGVGFIEAGNPASNNKDLDFFKEIQKYPLKNSIITAFGATRKKNTLVTDDQNLKLLIEANTKAVTIFGKSWDFHVTNILNTTLEENLMMIFDTVKFLKDNNKIVIYDAEHFFDGYKNNREYALETLKRAFEAKADYITLCDTNGGTFPFEIEEIVKDVLSVLSTSKIGIHCHNDIGCGVACSISAVKAGATMIQGTFTGFGERCGNANLSTIIPSLQVKLKYNLIKEENLKQLTTACNLISEVSNVNLFSGMPYVGKSAFAHKAGMHVDGVTKASTSFEHISPEMVGNARRFLISEVSGKSAIVEKIIKFAPNVKKSDKEIQLIIDKIKELEYIGYQFEAADGSFEILVRKILGKYTPFFTLEKFKIIGEDRSNGAVSSSAIIKISVDNKTVLKAAEGEGPVNALDKALRDALEVFYPQLKEVHLTDYKVRVLTPNDATAAKVRVLIESTDGKNYWSTIGVSTDIIEASWIALVDSIEYKLIKDNEGRN